MNPRTIIDLIRAALHQYRRDHGARLAASLAFYSALSIGPLLMMMVALISAAVGPAAAERKLLEQVTAFMGPQVTEFVGQVIQSTSEPPPARTFARLLEVIVLLWGSTKVFLELRDSLNLIWNVQRSPGKKLPRMLAQRLFGFGLVLALGFLVLVSLAFSAGISMLLESAGWLASDAGWIWMLANLCFTLMGSTFIFALLFRGVPEVEVNWRSARLGAIVTGVLFTMGTVVLKALLGGQAAPYGTTGSLIVFLLWVYYSAQILFFGAELTQVYSERISADD